MYFVPKGAFFIAKTAWKNRAEYFWYCFTYTDNLSHNSRWILMCRRAACSFRQRRVCQRLQCRFYLQPHRKEWDARDFDLHRRWKVCRFQCRLWKICIPFRFTKGCRCWILRRGCSKTTLWCCHAIAVIMDSINDCVTIVQRSILVIHWIKKCQPLFRPCRMSQHF